MVEILTVQKKMEYLAELGDSLEQLKEEMDGYLSDEEDYLPPTKFANPKSFSQFAWNVAGPSKGALLIYLRELKDHHVLGKQMEELGEVLEKHPMFGGKLWEMLDQDAGINHEDQAAFINENIAIVADLVEAEEANKCNAQNCKPAGIEKSAHAVAAGQISGDAEGISEHDPG